MNVLSGVPEGEPAVVLHQQDNAHVRKGPEFRPQISFLHFNTKDNTDKEMFPIFQNRLTTLSI